MNLKTPKTSNAIAISLIVVLAVPVFYYSLFVPFETDTGDSIVHYFFARYAFQNPMLYFDHWAKPFFTLLASPFAQFGFSGMKLFNGFNGLLSAWIAYCIAKKLELKFAWLAIIFVFFAPAYFVKLFSGYTEPLFGLMLIASIYLVLIKRSFSSAILISFLPFVRSEGLILMMVFGLFFLLQKNYKAIIFLVTGHVIYSLAGLLAGKNLLWIFTEIPYKLTSVYGKGDFAHYPTQLLLTLGVPLFLLSTCGIIMVLLTILWPKVGFVFKYHQETIILILGSFLSYFLFHIFSWRFGLFGSMGMSRVLTAMVPLLAVASVIGFNFLISWEYKSKLPIHAFIYFSFIGYILAFPFLHNPASINWKTDLHRTPEMELMQVIAIDIKKNHPENFLYYSNPYISYSMNINPFDQLKHLCFTDWQAQKTLKPNSLIVWDNWFSVVEERTDSTSLLHNPELKLVNRFETQNINSKSVFLVFSN